MHRVAPILMGAWICGAALPVRAQVQERHRGTWVLDVEASTREMAERAPARVFESFVAESESLIRYEWRIGADTMLVSITTKRRGAASPERGLYRVELREEGPDFTVYSVVEYGGSLPQNQALHLRLMDDGSLRIRESNASGWARFDEIMRHLVWRQETEEAAPPTAKRSTARTPGAPGPR